MKTGKNRRFSFDRSPFEIIITDYYYIIALLCALVLALHYFLMEMVQLDNPPSFRYIYAYGFSFLMSYILYHFFNCIYLKWRFGTCWSNRRSLYIKFDGKYNSEIIKVSLLRSISSVGITVCSFSMIYFAVSAGVNASIIVTLTSFSIFATAIYFRIFFNQMLQREHYIGMMLMLGCVIFSTLQFDSDEKIADN